MGLVTHIASIQDADGAGDGVQVATEPKVRFRA